jgi:DNA-binding LytR/AlgR family response regulator
MYNCLIIEDEPLASGILQDYIGEMADLHLVAACRDAMSASEYLRNHKLDVLFVDIHLPKINGLEFIKTIQNQYQVILTTAYHQYAMDGYDLNVVDYLVKPIEFSRFLQAIHKLRKDNPEGSSIVENLTDKSGFHYYNVDKRQVRIFDDDILFAESLKEYLRIYTAHHSIVTKLQIGELESMLNMPKLVRVHKSYIVNLDKVTAYSANAIEIDAHQIPIGRTYKEMLMKYLKV